MNIGPDRVLAALQEEFPQYRIWQEVVRGRARYVACSRRIGTRPHAMVTADAEELRAGLAAGPGQPPGAGRAGGARAERVVLAQRRRAAVMPGGSA